jgi:hypothetical protein
MKTTFWIILSIIVNLLTSNSMAQTEHQKYEVIRKYQEGIEIRYYPAAIHAKIYTNAQSYREISSPGFSTLAGYIFGGNDNNRKIAMTAPVHMEFGKKGASMSFVMPSAYDMDDLPNPNNPAVQLEESEPEHIAAIRFGGYASEEKIIVYSEKLRDFLLKNDIEYKGNFRYLGYNSPYKVINRRNEIIVQVVISENPPSSSETAELSGQ